MRMLTNRDNRNLYIRVSAVILILSAALEIREKAKYGSFSLPLLMIGLISGVAVLLLLTRFLQNQDRQMEEAVDCIHAIISGDSERRLECSRDGEIYRLFHEINTLASIQTAQNEREMQTNEFLKRTIYDISHQLKTPLAALNIYNGLIAESEDPEEIRKFTKSCDQELDRISSLIKNLLTLTRLDAGAVIFNKTRENLADLFEDIAERFSARVIQEVKTISLSGSEEAVLVCDRGWISEAFANIIQNALDHTEKDGQVSVSWEQSGNMLSVCIRDNGKGIAPEDIDNIFKRFYRSRQSSDRQGIGLGLPLAKTIIEAHDGTILVESRPGQGAAFTISFLNPSKL